MNALQAHRYKTSVIDNTMGVVVTCVADGVDKGEARSTDKTTLLVKNGEYIAVAAVHKIKDLAVFGEVDEVPDDALAPVIILLVLENEPVEQPIDSAPGGLFVILRHQMSGGAAKN